ncbi:MAG: hypothetical protein KAT43_01015 [Nanoarchaeota archaeon]|nr:hypothetical protein [Nanoarchaeota archaeon]
MSVMIMLGKPIELNDAWSIYRYHYLPRSQDDFIRANKEKLDQLALEFRLDMIECATGEEKIAVIRNHLGNAEEIVQQDQPYVEITLDEELCEEELRIFPEHFVSVLCIYYEQARASDFSIKELRDPDQTLLAYQIYHRDQFLHAMTIAQNIILLDNLEAGQNLSHNYIEVLRETAGL